MVSLNTLMWCENLKNANNFAVFCRFKGGMTKDDYLSSTNTIPDASAADYVECFRDTLESDLAASGGAKRKLYALDRNALRLELAVTIRVLCSTSVAKYVFDLYPVVVECIEILESKLRDRQHELEKLRGELKTGDAFPFIKLAVFTKHGSSILCWDPVPSGEFMSTRLDGKIKARRGGVYNVGGIVNTIAGSSQNV
ncbi:hypothetical protein PC110_g2564 [Phytophthora cactorum]|uniref:Uncharacterized protein n=1 Tax=Phytophthora cactorum TaxID=29920 RepID=A0A329SX98_9STRA|nr:hypothetical protein PC110_g2564 [Phytophthora cactorum]